MQNLKVRANKQFGKIRIFDENGTLYYLASDVAKALGYRNPSEAVTDHCRCIAKRDVPHPQSKGKTISMNFIPEADVYRLIVHSKLPKAEEFERWVFEEVVPKAVRNQTTVRKPEQLTLETSEYFYFDKTYNGKPVLTAADVEHFTGIGKSTIEYYLRNNTQKHVDYIVIEQAWLIKYKSENPKTNRMASSVFVVTKSGFVKLMKNYNCKAVMPKCFIEEKTTKLQKKYSIPTPKTDACIVALGVLQWQKEYYEKCKAEYKAKGTDGIGMVNCYEKDIDALSKSIKSVGMLVAAGY